MASAFKDRCNQPALPGQCRCDGAAKAVRITHLTSDGCVLQAGEDWDGAHDFLHLQIAGSIETNGKLEWVQGRRAQMRFFGQVHPAAIARLFARPSR